MQDYGKIITPTKKAKSLSKGAKQGLLVFLILFLVSIVFFAYQHLFEKESSPSNSSTTITKLIEEPSSGFAINAGDAIAVVHIEGVIQDENETYNQEWLLSTIMELTYDKNNVAILLYIDSPGGGVYQSDEVYLALEKYKSLSSKPVWAYFGPLSASGGYYIGCAADTIYANRNTLTGSIGVISSSSFDLTELMDTYGIKMTTITAGKNKNMMNVNSPLTDEQRAIMQSVADEAYTQFTTIVAESRNMDLNKVQELADGRIYTALQAKENGLIDNVDSLENTIISMEETLFEGKNMNEVYYSYEKKDLSLLDLLLDFSATAKSAFAPKEVKTLEVIKSNLGLPANMKYPAYYFHQ